MRQDSGGAPILTVGELNQLARTLMEEGFRSVRVEGEVSNCSRQAASGHMYFTLKDAEAEIAVAMFREDNRRLKFAVEDGLSVVAHGTVSIYERKGRYQLKADALEPSGRGALDLAFEQLRAKLESEGLFDQGRKRSLPRVPRHLGIVTSREGAALGDMLKILGSRFPSARVTIAPVRVQGEGAAAEITRAIAALNRLPGIEVVIAGRGGGSREDLWAFNEEVVARAIAASRVPVISAVGHEADVTIADYVADVRAATPTDAAKRAVPDRLELQQWVDEWEGRLRAALAARGERLARELDQLAGRLRRGLLVGCDRQRLRIGQWASRLAPAARAAGRQAAERLRRLEATLQALSPLAILARGYAVALRLPDRTVVTDAETLRPGEDMEVRVQRGFLRTRVQEISS